jgi:hypothetical protein
MSGDLIVLVADKNMEFSIQGVLNRPRSLQLCDFSSTIYVHPERDPGCATRPHEFLRGFAAQYRHALVVLDHQGCGREKTPPEELENAIEEQLKQSGWAYSAALVISPELENWVWSASPHVNTVLGWSDKEVSVQQWLEQCGEWALSSPKPDDPKRALERALREVRKQRSSSLYAELAKLVSLERCTDRAFLKLKTTLGTWFPIPSADVNP